MGRVNSTWTGYYGVKLKIYYFYTFPRHLPYYTFFSSKYYRYGILKSMQRNRYQVKKMLLFLVIVVGSVSFIVQRDLPFLVLMGHLIGEKKLTILIFSSVLFSIQYWSAAHPTSCYIFGNTVVSLSWYLCIYK